MSGIFLQRVWSNFLDLTSDLERHNVASCEECGKFVVSSECMCCRAKMLDVQEG